MLDQQRRRDHANAVVHPADRPELAHAGIDDRISGLALLPGAQSLGIFPPAKRESRPERFARQMRKIVEEVVGKLPPVQLANVGVGAFPRAILASRMEGVPALARADLAERQMGRKPRRAINTRRIPVRCHSRSEPRR
jgi:hypothetical protein